MEEKEINPTDMARKWANELKLAKKEDDRWVRRSRKIIKRYRDERTTTFDGAKRYNLLWSNIQTLYPALYGRVPHAQVERRWKDQDPVGRTASTIIERALNFEIEHYGDFNNAMQLAVNDRLLCGRGVVWVRFEQKEIELAGEQEPPQEAYAETPMNAFGQSPLQPQEAPSPTIESTPVDYVYWEDFRCTPSRTWDEVTWVARRVYMAKEEVKNRFGEDVAKDIPYTHEPLGLEEIRKNSSGEADTDAMKKAQVWEIWCKTSESVYWIAEGYDKLLDMKSDPYGLENFFPCPKPMYSTQTTDTLVPVPDYALYQDQAEEIDSLTQRIALLVEACKVVGVYDASQPSIQRLMTEGVDNVLIPVDTWAAFSEKGGLKGTVDFLPLDMVIGALNECYKAREQAKQVVYDVTGLSDIIRGSSMASETATAQQIKGQYASMRLKRMQHDVARFASDILRIKAQIMCDLYSPETLVKMSGVEGTQDAQYLQQAIPLIKNEVLRTFKIEVAADSLIEMDEAGEKQARTEFLSAFGNAMHQALPIAQAAPEMKPVIMEALQFVIRTFKGGRQLENSLENATQQMAQPKPPQPNPEMMKMQAQQQADAARMQHEQQKAQFDSQLEMQRQQLEQAKAQAQNELEQMKLQSQQVIEAQKMQHEKELEMMKQQAESERAQAKMEMEASVKILIAQIGAKQAMDTQMLAATQAADAEVAENLNDDPVQQMAGMHSEMLEGIKGLVDSLKAPKRRVIERGPDGRAIGAVEISE